MRKSKYYVRLVIAYVIVIGLYTLAACGIFIYKSNELFELDRSQKEQVFLEQMKEKLDTPLIVATNIMNQLKAGERLALYVRDKTRDHYQVTQVFDELRKDAGAFSNFGFSVSVTKMSDELVITPRQTERKSDYYASIGLIGAEAERFERYLRNDRSFNRLFVALSPERLRSAQREFTLIKREWVENQEVLFFITFYERQLLPQWLETKEEGFAIYHNGQPVAVSGGANPGALVAIAEWIAGVRPDAAEQGESDDFDISPGSAERPVYVSGKEPQAIAKVTHAGYTIREAPSGVLNGWRYIYAVPRAKLPVRELLLDTLLIYSVFACLGLLLSLYIAKTSYDPVRRLVARFQGDSAAETRDEFAFIEHERIRMLQTNVDLQQQLEGYRIPLKEKYMKDLLLGLQGQEAEQAVRELGLAAPEAGLTVIVLEVNDEEIAKLYDKDAWPTVRRHMTRLLDEHLEAGERLSLLELDYRRFCLVMRADATGEQHRRLQLALAAIKRELGLPAAAAFGRSAADWAELAGSYRSASQYLELRHAFGERSVLTPEEAEAVADRSFYYPFETERQLLALIKEGRKPEAMELIGQTLRINAEEKRLSPADRAAFLTMLLATTQRVLQATGRTWEQVYGEAQPPERLTGLDLSAASLPPLLSHFERLADSVDAGRRRSDRHVVEQMVDYLHEHYVRDVSLTDLSEQFHLTPNYISTIFKDYTGSNFKDYLNEYRVNRAKALLRSDPSLSVGELAQRVGCNHAMTFSRMFKKYEGVSPGQYAKRQAESS